VLLVDIDPVVVAPGVVVLPTLGLSVVLAPGAVPMLPVAPALPVVPVLLLTLLAGAVPPASLAAVPVVAPALAAMPAALAAASAVPAPLAGCAAAGKAKARPKPTATSVRLPQVPRDVFMECSCRSCRRGVASGRQGRSARCIPVHEWLAARRRRFAGRDHLRDAVVALLSSLVAGPQAAA